MEILQIVQMNKLMLLKILRNMGLTKDEIFELIRNPEMEIKEILYEFNHGSEQVKNIVLIVMSYCFQHISKGIFVIMTVHHVISNIKKKYQQTLLR